MCVPLPVIYIREILDDSKKNVENYLQLSLIGTKLWKISL